MPSTPRTEPPEHLLALAIALTATACAVPSVRPNTPPAATEPTVSTDRPSFSASPLLVPVGHYQIETGYTWTQRRDQGVTTEVQAVPDVLARYRALDRLELRATWGGVLRSTAHDDGGRDSRSDLADLGLGAKIPLAEEDGWLPNASLVTSLTLGTGNAATRTGNHAVPTQILAWSHSLGEHAAFGGNLVWSLPYADERRHSQTAASLYATWTCTTDTTLFAEYFVLSPYAPGTRSAHSVDAGVLYVPQRRVQLDARVGKSLDGVGDDLWGGVGISFLF
jgi:hypothetical protein